MSYPSAARPPTTSPHTAPRLTVRRFATFSTSTNRGRSSPTARAISRHRTVSACSNPLRFPAVLAPLHGNPPAMTSTGGAPSPTARTSSKTGTPGNRCSRIPRRHGSLSQSHRCSSPARCSPNASSPIPSKSPPTFTRPPRRGRGRSSRRIDLRVTLNDQGQHPSLTRRDLPNRERLRDTRHPERPPSPGRPPPVLARQQIHHSHRLHRVTVKRLRKRDPAGLQSTLDAGSGEPDFVRAGERRQVLRNRGRRHDPTRTRIITGSSEQRQRIGG